MRRGVLLSVCLAVLLVLLAPALVSADETVNLESRVLETFDPDDRTTEWQVRGSKFVTEGFPRKTYAAAWPEALFGSNKEEEELEVLGTHFKFDRQGYNYIEIIPVEEGDEGDMEPNPIPIPGKVKDLDLWVWGSDFDYYMEVHLQDSRGVVHTLDLGNLDYTGWKNLRVSIPGHIPQTGQYAPYLEGLRLVKFVVWTQPTERVHNCYLYIDHVKVLTDLFVDRFDGDGLAQPDRVDEIWQEEQEE
ncbi:MAG: flagellar filament outer layer protein FlaA [Spirochaetia bacterium]